MGWAAKDGGHFCNPPHGATEVLRLEAACPGHAAGMGTSLCFSDPACGVQPQQGSSTLEERAMLNSDKWVCAVELEQQWLMVGGSLQIEGEFLNCWVWRASGVVRLLSPRWLWPSWTPEYRASVRALSAIPCLHPLAPWLCYSSGLICGGGGVCVCVCIF